MVEGDAEGGVDLRITTSRALRTFVRDINRTARTLEPEFPGIRPTFRLPRTASYPMLITQIRVIISAVTPIQVAFVDAGLPPTFLAELQDLLAAFEQATVQKQQGGMDRIAGTAALKATANRGVIAATKLDACVRNLFRHHPEMLAAWTHARHIKRAPRRSVKTAPSVAPREIEVQPRAETPVLLANKPGDLMKVSTPDGLESAHAVGRSDGGAYALSGPPLQPADAVARTCEAANSPTLRLPRHRDVSHELRDIR